MIDIDSQIRTSPAECNLAHAQSLEYANKLQGDCGVPQDAMQGEEGATTAGTTDALGSIHWGQCIITDIPPDWNLGPVFQNFVVWT